MAKTEKTHHQRFTSFRNLHCPYCGGPGKLQEKTHTTKSGKVILDGYRGICLNDEPRKTGELCHAENFFSRNSARDW